MLWGDQLKKNLQVAIAVLPSQETAYVLATDTAKCMPWAPKQKLF